MTTLRKDLGKYELGFIETIRSLKTALLKNWVALGRT